jgi:hypothetical protein
MKKIAFLILILIIPISINAASTISQETRGGGFRVLPRNIDELNQAMELRGKNFKKERAGMNEINSKIYENQNKLRNGVQNLMMMEKMIRKNGLEISILAEDLNNLTKNTLKFEQEFAERSSFKKFFFGQKKEIVENFLKEINEREKKILKIKELIESSEVSVEIEDVLQEQFIDIEDEQNRLNSYFQGEIKRKGILTWLVNIFD